MLARVVDVALVVAALPVVLATGYLLLLALLSWRPRVPRAGAGRLRFDVIVPAHDEEAGIAATVRSLAAVEYDPALRRIVVVADNCTDATAERARAAGATVVLERREPDRRGKGYALEHAFAWSVADGWADALCVVDADTTVSPNLLAAFAARLERGALAVQADNVVGNASASWRTELMAIAFATFNTLRSLGRERLGVSVGLRGNGMCVATRLVREVPHAAFSVVEDLEYGIRVGIAGHRVHFAHEARVSSVMVTSAEKARSQRLRWEGGRSRMARQLARPLLLQAIRARSAILVDLAVDLLVPPVAVLAIASAAGTVGSAAASFAAGRPLAALSVWGICLASMAAYVARGWWLSGTGLRGLSGLLHVPAYVAWKLVLALSPPPPTAERWIRTEREDRP